MATDLEDDANDATVGLGLTPRERRVTGPALASPDNLQRYVMLEQVGAGGMGVVHRAYDPKLRREVAIKMLNFDRREGAKALRAETRILREARAMAQLSHPNVLPVHDVEQVGGLVYIVMEYVDGETLSRWLRRKARRWPEVVEVFRQAGRGLEAAHQAGIIHRDFKPSNVLLGNKGRVLVTDFGLARANDGHEPRDGDEPEPSAARSSRWSSDDLHEPDLLTEVGEVLGTPPYMAPEQLRGDPVDARADQYAFCVALFEGLYGRRPFRQRNQVLLLAAKETPKLEPESSAHVPSWLYRIVERGLHPSPSARFATMAELLAALSRDPTRARRRWVWLGSGVVLGAATIGLRLLTTSRESPCPEPVTVADELWGEPARERVRAALLATSVSYAADTAERVTRRLDDYARAWAEGHVDACRTNRVLREQSAEAFDLRMACLGRHRTELETTVETLTEKVGVGTLQRAAGMVAALPDPQLCADVEALRSRHHAADPDEAAELDELRRRLDRARVLGRAGRNDEADALALGVEIRAQALADAVLLAETRLLRGEVLGDERELSRAEDVLRKGFGDAVEGRDARLAVDIALELGAVMGMLQTRTPEAEHWADQARAWLRGIDEDDPRWAELLLLDGGIQQVAGRLDQARTSFAGAVARLEAGPATTDLAQAHRTLGLALAALGELDQAAARFAEEVNSREALLGTQHPEVARALQSQGGALFAAGKLTRALPLLERALAIREAALGPDHPLVAVTLDALGSLRDDLGEHDEARELFERALRILESSEDRGSNALVRLRGNLAQALRHAGKYEEAATHLEKVAARLESEFGPAHPERVDMLRRLGEILIEADQLPRATDILEQADQLRARLPEQGALVSADVARALARARHLRSRSADAQALLLEALEIYRALGPTLDPRRGRALLELGVVLLDSGDPTGARARLELAIPLLTTPSVPADALARARFSLARAIVAQGPTPKEREHALALASDARAGLSDHEAEQRRIDDWLAQLRR